MLAQKETAAHSDKQAATKNESRNKPYQSCAQQSSRNLKEQIGTLLLALQAPLSQEQRREYWAQCESMLKQYLDFRCSGGQL